MFLSMSIAVSIVILLTTFFVQKPLEFSIFPTVLLATTLFRIVLNVSTTRLILTRADQFGELAAGQVIQSFSNFVTGENIVVGIVIFAIFIIVQFVIITKGATRISEVAARFTLDAMPGRQMAIDADLNAGIINEKEAQLRREELTEQSDFFGSMDGASKFVRGDAIASVIITFVNVLGGLFIGIFQHGIPISDALGLYTKLTIGDGLVSQVPALLISLATGILVTRSSRPQNLPQLAIQQLFLRPVVLVITAFFLVFLVLTGMPILPLLTLGTICLGLAYVVNRKNVQEQFLETQKKTELQNSISHEKENEEEIENYLAIDQMELEIGIGLISLADPQYNGDLLNRFRQIRKTIASEMGFIVPKIRIRDSLILDDNQYRIKINGEPVAMGMIYPNMLLAIDSGLTTGKLQGIQTKDPAFGSLAYWINPDEKQRALDYGFTIVEPSGIIETHLTEIIRKEAAELLTRDATRHLIMQLKETSPVVVDELIPEILKLSQVQQILQMLLKEQIPIRQLGAILETLSVYASRTTDPVLLTEFVRTRLGRTLCVRLRDEDETLHVFMLDPELEDLIRDGFEKTDQGIIVHLSPNQIENFCLAIGKQMQKMNQSGFPQILLVSPAIRVAVRQITESALPSLTIMSFNEISKDTKVDSVGTISSQVLNNRN